MRRFIRLAMVAIFVCFSLGVPSSTLRAQGNVEGNTYTSPRFDYQVQWESPWYFVAEGSEGGIDYVVISDGVSFVQFRFVFDPGADATEVIGLITDAKSNSEYVSNVQPLADAQGIPVSGGDARHAWAGFTGTHTLDDGSAVELIIYEDVTILPGGVVSWVTATTPSYFYDDSVLQGWQNLIATALVIPETAQVVPTTVPEATTAPATQTTVPPAVSPTTVIASGAGEPAPAFAAGPWRISARAVDQGESIEYLGLGFIDGMRWVVLYTDVTNWSAADETLDVAGLTLVTAGGLVAPDQASTQSAASLLGLEPVNGSSVTVVAGGSTRLALVYSIPMAEENLILEAQGTQLPLKDAVGRQLDVTDLSTVSTPPAVTAGTLAAVMLMPSGELQLRVKTESGSMVVMLAGVSLPVDAACFDRATTLTTVGELAGAELWLETDPAVPDAYYVWYVDDQGNRVMLSQTLIAEGLATEGDLPDAARFGAWIEQTEEMAQAAGTGLWTTCAGQL